MSGSFLCGAFSIVDGREDTQKQTVGGAKTQGQEILLDYVQAALEKKTPKDWKSRFSSQETLTEFESVGMGNQ